MTTARVRATKAIGVIGDLESKLVMVDLQRLAQEG